MTSRSAATYAVSRIAVPSCQFAFKMPRNLAFPRPDLRHCIWTKLSILLSIHTQTNKIQHTFVLLRTNTCKPSTREHDKRNTQIAIDNAPLRDVKPPYWPKPGKRPVNQCLFMKGRSQSPITQMTSKVSPLVGGVLPGSQHSRPCTGMVRVWIYSSCDAYFNFSCSCMQQVMIGQVIP